MNWNYQNQKEPNRYGDDDLSYVRAARFLDDGDVEDWGCGSTYAKRFFKSKYTGVDGAAGFADVVADLRTYTSHTSGILLRHVLEHNYEWEKILRNALASADKIALVIFTPFGEKTKQISYHSVCEVPDISFQKTDLTECFTKWEEETLSSKTFYGTETIFYIHTK